MNQNPSLTSNMPLLNPGSTRIILASQSPRRIELLKRIIPEFEVKVSNIREDNNSTIVPWELVGELSYQKARNIARQIPAGIIIGADSVVVLHNKILGKPSNADDAFNMLRLLSGKVHQVYTGFTIITKPQHSVIKEHEVTHVKFRRLEAWEIEKYIESGQPLDKAGAYGIQDDGAVFIESINGCYYNVVGLPITKIFLALRRLFKQEEGKN
jgi:septum formation protein